MKYEEYINEVNELPIGEDIEGYLEFFDPRMHKIFNNKLIFIFPNGKCLFMPYTEKDKRTRLEIKYTHRSYIIRALTHIIKELGYDEKEFIEANIDASDRDFIIKRIMEQGISLLYDCGKIDGNGKLKNKTNRYSIFFKSEELTEEQKKTIIRMKGILKRQKYKMMICELLKGVDYSYYADYFEYITYKDSDKNEFEIDEFYELLGLQKKHDEHDGENR